MNNLVNKNSKLIIIIESYFIKNKYKQILNKYINEGYII